MNYKACWDRLRSELGEMYLIVLNKKLEGPAAEAIMDTMEIALTLMDEIETEASNRSLN